MKKIIVVLVISLSCFNIYSQWTTAIHPTNKNLYGMYFTSISNGIIGGDLQGNIYKTTDGANTITSIGTGTTSWYLDVYFINSSTGFASGQSGSIVKTTNSGQSWSVVLSSAPYMHSIRFPSPQVGYAVGATGIYKSTNGGDSWFSLNDPYSNYLLGVYFSDNNTGYICGEGNLLIKTINGGASWTSLTSPTQDINEWVTFTDNNTGYVAGKFGRILKTVNAGSTWQTLSTGTSEWLFNVFMLNANVGWASGMNGTIIKTTDAGTSWMSQPTGVTNWIRQVQFLDENNGFACCDSGLVLKTSNGGSSSGCYTKVTTGPEVNDNAWGEGTAWGDYDNDGNQDLVVTNYNDNCSSCNYPILLYHNNGNGSFSKITNGPIATEITQAFGCSWGDYDNDGKLDLFVCTGFGKNNLLFHNEGNGNFTKVSPRCNGSIVSDGGFSVACSWLDYDNDGWLDLFVANQGNDFLYHNNRNGSFTKITTGAIVTDNSNARSCATGDYDNDSYTDVIVTTWGGANRLYHNNGNGSFNLTSGLISSASSYYGGALFGDYDNDGYADLFIVAFNSTTNLLYHNNGNGTFTQIQTGPGAETGAQGFGCSWADVNNDGYLDIYVTNWRNTTNFLYKNLGNGSFVKVTNESVTTDPNWGIGNSAADINMDGKIDLFTANNGTTSSPLNDELYINTCQNLGNYIGIKLKGGCFNTSAIGTKVIIKAGGKTITRVVSGGEGYHSESMLWQLVGIGNANVVDSIIIKWPTGDVQRLCQVNANQYISIVETQGNIIASDKKNSDIPTTYSTKNYPNPFNPNTRISFDLPLSSATTLRIYNAVGKLVGDLVNSNLNAGHYEVDFNGENLSSGIYYYKLISGPYTETRKMVLVK